MRATAGVDGVNSTDMSIDSQVDGIDVSLGRF